MKYIEKMVVQSNSHGGPGISILCKAIYWYFVTGSSEAAAKRVTVNDCSERVKQHIEKMRCFNYMKPFYRGVGVAHLSALFGRVRNSSFFEYFGLFLLFFLVLFSLVFDSEFIL